MPTAAELEAVGPASPAETAQTALTAATLKAPPELETVGAVASVVAKPETPVATTKIGPASSQATIPELIVSPPSGPPGISFEVSISGKPEQRLIVHWEDYSLASGWQHDYRKIRTDNQGKASVVLSWKYKGEYRVWVVDEATAMEANPVTVAVG